MGNINKETGRETLPTNELRLTGMNPKILEQIHNIASNCGVPATSLLKPKITEWVNSYPEHMKQPAKKV